MDVTNSFVATITPPPYQLGAEEARKDAKQREQIPATLKMENSAKDSEIADEHGNTQGQNSILQNQAISYVNSSNHEVVVDKKQKDKKEQTYQQKTNEQQKQTQTTINKEQIDNATYINKATKLYIAAPRAPISSSSNENKKDENTTNTNKEENIFIKRGQAIAKKYASILPRHSTLANLNITA